MGRVAIVTGGTRGIGAAISIGLKNAGYSVAANYAGNDEAANAFSKETGIAVYKFDVSDFDACQTSVAKIVADIGPVDVLINNAGITRDGTMHRMTDEQWQSVIDTNLGSCFNMSRAVIEGMRDRSFGRIVNIGGMTARITAPLRVTNGIVNAGVANLTKQLSSHLAPHGITINCVHPGTTVTERMKSGFERRARDGGVSYEDIVEESVAGIPLGRLIEPQDIAAAVLWFCSPLAEMVTGQCIAVDGGSASSINY